MSGGTPGVPHRPGPVGRIVRLLLGLLVLQSVVGAGVALIDGPRGAPDLDDTSLVIAFVLSAWLTPTVYDIGLSSSLGHRWRLLVATAIAAATVAGVLVGAPGTGLTIGILVWMSLTLGWLGIAFLLAAILRTPGCEMRSLPHLASLVRPGERTFVACPGMLQPLDGWEARTTGRGEPYVPT